MFTITQFLPASGYFLDILPKYIPQHHLLESTHPAFFPSYEATNSTRYKITDQIVIFCIIISFRMYQTRIQEILY